MSKTAFMFPGQGAQYAGMGLDLYESFPVVRETLDKINNVLGYDLLKIIMYGPEDELILTENTQPAILAVSYAIYKLVEQKGIKASACLGLSLGEYTALTASNVIKFEDALLLVKKRGMFIQEAASKGTGGMAAIIGLDEKKVMSLINDVSEYGLVEAVNYNCPGQISIAGEKEAIKKAVELAKKYGAIKAVELKVSAPFHSSMLKPASLKLENELKNIRFGQNSMDIVSNVDADYYKFTHEAITDRLSRQVYHPVLFEKSIRRLIDDGYDTFIELGPGKALSGFVKRIDKKVRVFNVSDVKSFEKLTCIE